MYNLRILDINRRRIAVIDRLESWRYTRRPSEATEISVTLPREDVEAALPAGVDVYAFLAPYQVVTVGRGSSAGPDEGTHRHARIAHYVEIYRGTKHVVTGRISKRSIKDDTVSIQCHTEEIVLESHITPAQYGRKWDHWDLADVARDMLRGWHVQRVKDKTQWDAAIERVNVDTSTEPGVVMLAKSGGKYVSQGHITLRFSKADVPGFHSWDRIRWTSDNGAPVRTTMQWRADGGPWSQEMEGALPDEIGVVPGSVDADIIDVRINLYTEDQETEDSDGNQVGQTPFVFAVEMVARTKGALTAGDIPAVAGVTVSGLEADGASALNVLSQACAQAGWEFWVSEGKLNIAKEMGQDRTSSVLLRAGTNMTVQTLSEGDDELVNVLTAYGPGEGINRLQVVRRHEESIAQYGEHRGVQTFEGASTLADLIEAADAYLEEHAAPVPAYRVDVQYPYGEEPEFGCGDNVRIADPRNGIVTVSRIEEEQRSYSASGLRTTLYLGLPAPNLSRQFRPRPPQQVRPLAKPVISVSTIPGGIRVVDTTIPTGRWSTSVVHVSTTKGFTPSAETVAKSGRETRFDVTGLVPGTRYYARLIRFDERGIPSDPSDEMSAIAGYISHEDLDPTPPEDVTGLVVDFTGPDAVATWQPASRATRYRVRILDVIDNVKRTVEVAGTSYRYSYADNVQDFGGNGSPAIKVSVEGKNEAGFYSQNPAIMTATCPEPAQPTISARSDRAEIRWTVTSDVPPTWKSTTVAVGTFSQTAPVLNGVVDAATAGLSDGQLVTLAVTINDVFGRSSDPREISVTVKYIDKLAFVQSLKPVELVSALPELPNPDYPQGSVVFLATDNKLYRSTGDGWTAAIPAADLDGEITETQISDSAITTPKIAANAVTADKVAANAVTTDKLAANSVTAGKIAAGAVKADAIDVDELSAISANLGTVTAGKLLLTGDMAIINEDGTLQITSAGIEIESEEVGGTQWTPGGLVFNRPDGTRSGYVRAVAPGVAQDGDYVQLNFINEPVVILSPARAITYEPSVGGIQKLRLEAANASHEGFQVVAKLVRHDAQGSRVVFPRTQKYAWYSGTSDYCTDGGHASEPNARAWSEHRLVTTGSSKIFTIGPGATGAIVRIREMLHAHAFQGVYHALNTITYRVRIRAVGQSTWLQTRGPYTRSIDTKSSLLSSSFKWSHNLVSHVFEGLPPGGYEIQVEITNKTIRSGEGRNTQNACTLIVEEIEEMAETEIQLPEPITVHYVAFESDSPGGEEDD